MSTQTTLTNKKNFKIGDFCTMYIYKGWDQKGHDEFGQIIDIREGLYPEDGKMIEETKITILTGTGEHIQRLDAYCQKINESTYTLMNSNLLTGQMVMFRRGTCLQYFGEMLDDGKVKYLGTNNPEEAAHGIRQLTPDEVKTAVFYKFCIENYEEGFDTFVECYSKEELQEYVLKHNTFVELMQEAQRSVNLHNERKQEIQAEIF